MDSAKWEETFKTLKKKKKVDKHKKANLKSVQEPVKRTTPGADSSNHDKKNPEALLTPLSRPTKIKSGLLSVNHEDYFLVRWENPGQKPFKFYTPVRFLEKHFAQFLIDYYLSQSDFLSIQDSDSDTATESETKSESETASETESDPD